MQFGEAEGGEEVEKGQSGEDEAELLLRVFFLLVLVVVFVEVCFCDVFSGNFFWEKKNAFIKADALYTHTYFIYVSYIPCAPAANREPHMLVQVKRPCGTAPGPVARAGCARL